MEINDKKLREEMKKGFEEYHKNLTEEYPLIIEDTYKEILLNAYLSGALAIKKILLDN